MLYKKFMCVFILYIYIEYIYMLYITICECIC